MPNDKATLTKAARWIRTQYNRRRIAGHHPSHLLAEIALEAEKRYDLGTYGVEGWCDECGNEGISYLNAGDTYAPTIVLKSSRWGWSVHVAMGGWGPYAERG